MQKDSHLILKHRVRVVHLYEPKIIHTDISNFREMVQKLTGKSSEITKRKRTSFVKPREGKVMKEDGGREMALLDGFGEMDDDLFVEELSGFRIYPNSGIHDSKYM